VSNKEKGCERSTGEKREGDIGRKWKKDRKKGRNILFSQDTNSAHALNLRDLMMENPQIPSWFNSVPLEI
jgi:hypothetical protein